MTYGSSPSLTTTVNGLQNGDTVAQTLSTVASVAVGGSKSSSNNYTAGTHALTASSAVERLGYLIGGYTQGTLTVNRKNVTASYTASSKTYDTTNFATVTGSLTGVVSGDSVSVSKTSSVFSDANVADGKKLRSQELVLVQQMQVTTLFKILLQQQQLIFLKHIANNS